MIHAKLAGQASSLTARLTAKAALLAAAHITDRAAHRNRSISHWQRPQQLWPLFAASRKG